MSLKDRIIQGIAWNALSRVGQEGIGLLTTLILVRLISPDEFGLLGMVSVFTGFIFVFQDLGLGPSIIQNKDINQEQISSIFWLNISFSILLALITIGCAPLISRFYEEPAITPIVTLLAITIPLSALTLIPTVLLEKRMAFKQLAIIQNIALITSSIAGITTAFLGLGVWALVWQQLLYTFSNTVLTWLIVPWDLTWAFSYRKIKKQIHFGITLQAGSLWNYGARNSDDLIIGKVAGTAALGIYQMAYRLMLWPLQKISHVVGQVMFPALSGIQDDKERVKQVFLRVTRSIALITFPMVLGLWVVAPSAVYVILGDKWIEVIPIFQVLCILGLPQSIGTNTGWIFLSQGRPDIRLKLQVAFSALFIASFVIGINWGAIGVAICYTMMSLLLTPIQFQVAGKLIGMTFGDVVRTMAGIFGCATLMAVFVWSVDLMLPNHWPHWIYLMVLIPLGIMVYWVLVHLFNLKAYREMREVFREQVRSRVRTSTVTVEP